MHTLYTLGYTGTKPAQLLTLAEKLDAALVDVRLSPRSRHPMWDGAALAQAWGERYRHIRDLGNVNYKAPERGIMLMSVENGTLTLVRLLAVRPAIILCACSDWRTCHRRVVAEEMQTRYQAQVEHLTLDDIKRLIDNSPQQQPLF